MIMMASSGNDKYIYNLPYAQHQELCRILDRDTKWEELGGKYMEFDMMTIHDLRRDYHRGVSPTGQLLMMWGQQNHTVVQLFILLSKMHHYQAMLVLKPLVDSKYHALIYEGEENVGVMLLKGSALDSSTVPGVSGQKENGTSASAAGATASHISALDKNMNVGSHNMNMPEVTHLVAHNKIVLPSEPLVEHKILNRAPDEEDTNSNVPFAQDVPINFENSNGEMTGIGSGIRVGPGTAIGTGSGDGAAGIRVDAGAGTVAALRMENKESANPEQGQQMQRQLQQPRKLSTCSDVSSVAETCLAIPSIPYTELEHATNGWDRNTIIGKGGFGTVFRGNWKNTLVAIKRIEQRGADLTESNQAQLKQSVCELRVLNACRHDNILPIYGCSLDRPEPCLVYQFMPHGSLEDRLLCRQGTKPLTWLQRHKIAEGTARGLQFLHSKHFIHGDIKSANILLDNNYEPRIGDFGLAREGPQGHYTHMKVSQVHGTRPYLPDDFLRSKKMSTKVDTFSFGIVMFELATGLRAYEESRAHKLLKDHVEQCKDEHLLSLCDARAAQCIPEVFLFLIHVGTCCTKHRARDRPEMEEVLKQLMGGATYRLIADKAQQLFQKNSTNATGLLPGKPEFLSPVPPASGHSRNTFILQSPSQLPFWGQLAMSPEPSNKNMIPVGMSYLPSPGTVQPPPAITPFVQFSHVPAPADVRVSPVLTVHQEESAVSHASSQDSEEEAAASRPPLARMPNSQVAPLDCDGDVDGDGVLPLISALGIKNTPETSRLTDSLQEPLESTCSAEALSGSTNSPEAPESVITAQSKQLMLGEFSS